MIYIVEVPHQGRPHAWFAFDRKDFVLKIRALWPEADEDFDECAAAISRDVKAYRIHLNEDLAIFALQKDPLLDPREAFYAHMAFREQLIAMDAMEEDI